MGRKKRIFFQEKKNEKVSTVFCGSWPADNCLPKIDRMVDDFFDKHLNGTETSP